MSYFLFSCLCDIIWIHHFSYSSLFLFNFCQVIESTTLPNIIAVFFGSPYPSFCMRPYHSLSKICLAYCVGYMFSVWTYFAYLMIKYITRHVELAFSAWLIFYMVNIFLTVASFDNFVDLMFLYSQQFLEVADFNNFFWFIGLLLIKCFLPKCGPNIPNWISFLLT